MVALGVLVCVVALAVTAGLMRVAVPKIAAIAQTTAKEGLAQPLFYVLLAVGIFALLLFPFVSYNTLGEDVKMLKTEGLTLIKVLAIILALWTASVSIADEIEGRTALTLLSKPVSRRQFVLGKFLGILVPVAILFLVLGAIFLATVSYKVAYDARENSYPDPSWRDCSAEMLQVSPGLAASFLETMILASISVAISTRLPMLPNLIICASIYVLGHLVPMLLESSAVQFPLVSFTGKLISAVLPGLAHFNMESLVSAGKQLPPLYLLAATAYSLGYCAVAMLVALLLFEDRDLA
jgi:hypothetical protein